MTKNHTNIGLSLFGGFMGVMFTFGSALIYNYMDKYYNYIVEYSPQLFVIPFYFGGVSLLAIFGALIELKSLRAGSLICLISGILLVICMIINQRLIYIFLYFILGDHWIIIGVALGIWVVILLIGGIVGFIEWLRES